MTKSVRKKCMHYGSFCFDYYFIFLANRWVAISDAFIEVMTLIMIKLELLIELHVSEAIMKNLGWAYLCEILFVLSVEHVFKQIIECGYFNERNSPSMAPNTLFSLSFPPSLSPPVRYRGRNSEHCSNRGSFRHIDAVRM